MCDLGRKLEFILGGKVPSSQEKPGIFLVSRCEVSACHHFGVDFNQRKFPDSG